MIGLVLLAGCGLGQGSLDDFKSLEVGDCVEGNVMVEYQWQRIDCDTMVPNKLDQYQVSWVGSTADADKLGFLGARFSGECPLPLQAEGFVACFR